MFGKRQTFGGNTSGAPVPAAPRTQVPSPSAAPQRADSASRAVGSSLETGGRASGGEVVDVRSPEAVARDKEYFQTKSAIFSALIDSIDLSQLATMEQEAAREEIRDIVAEIIALKSIIMSSRCWPATTSPTSW